MNALFTFGKTVSGDAFTDRENETTKLVSNFQYGVNTFIVSPRRWGKTSLVKKAKSLAENDKLKIVYVDVQQCRSEEEFCERYASAVLTQTANKMDEWLENAKSFLSRFSFGVNTSPDPNSEMSIKIQLSSKERPTEDLLQLPEKIATRKGIHIVVCIDEFQQITRYPEKNVEALLRTHIQKLSNANFVFSGSRRRLMEDMFFSSKRPFFQSAKAIRLEPIEKDVYLDFASHHFKEAGKDIDADAFGYVYDTFWGVTFYVQRIMKDAFADTPVGGSCNMDTIKQLIADFIDENDSHLREQLSFITEAQKELLYAIHAEGQVQSITSAAFNKKHRLRSPSSTQAASLKLLEYDLITRKEKIYSLTDPLLNLWLTRKR